MALVIVTALLGLVILGAAPYPASLIGIAFLLVALWVLLQNAGL